MPEGVSRELIEISVLAWCISLLILCRFVSLKVSIIVTTIKISIVFVYFGWFYDGSWTIKDDNEYHTRAQELLKTNFNPINLLFTAEGMEELKNVSDRSRHVLYTWWVYSTQYVAGSVYYAPVFFNVVLTFIAAAILYRLVLLEGFSEAYAKGLLLAFLLHWDVLAWSSLISIKDTMAMTLTIGAFGLIWLALKKPVVNARTFLALLGLGIVVYILTFVRFYIPILLLGSLLCYSILSAEGTKKYYLLLGAIAVLFGIVVFTPLVQFHIEKDIVLDWKATLVGVFRFPLTPRPWSLEPAYTFLLLPSILHWIFFVPAVVGAFSLWRRSELAKLLILFLATAIVFYAIVEMLQNPRQRYQLSYIIVWMQYHSVVLLINKYCPHNRVRVPV